MSVRAVGEKMVLEHILVMPGRMVLEADEGAKVRDRILEVGIDICSVEIS